MLQQYVANRKVGCGLQTPKQLRGLLSRPQSVLEPIFGQSVHWGRTNVKPPFSSPCMEHCFEVIQKEWDEKKNEEKRVQGCSEVDAIFQAPFCYESFLRLSSGLIDGMRHSWILWQGQLYQEVFTSCHTDGCLQLTAKSRGRSCLGSHYFHSQGHSGLAWFRRGLVFCYLSFKAHEVLPLGRTNPQQWFTWGPTDWGAALLKWKWASS